MLITYKTADILTDVISSLGTTVFGAGVSLLDFYLLRLAKKRPADLSTIFT